MGEEEEGELRGAELGQERIRPDLIQGAQNLLGSCLNAGSDSAELARVSDRALLTIPQVMPIIAAQTTHCAIKKEMPGSLLFWDGK